MDMLQTIAVSLHFFIGIIGILFNSVLLFLIVKRSPANIRVYSVMLFNFAATDLFACISGIFVAQRIIPCGKVLAFTSGGLCKAIGVEACFIGHCLNLTFYSHTLWSTLISFSYRYYVLFYTTSPQRKYLITLVLVFFIPSASQSISCSWYALDVNPDAGTLIAILKKHQLNYNLEGETLYGITNVFDWRILFPILHMTVPITPVYIIIIILRKRIVHRLSTGMVSPNSKRLHQQLLGALTAQAALPFFYFIAVLTYAPGQLNLFNHPILEYATFVCFSFIPALSPLINFYFIHPYRRAIFFFIRRPRIDVTGGSTWKSQSYVE